MYSYPNAVNSILTCAAFMSCCVLNNPLLWPGWFAAVFQWWPLMTHNKHPKPPNQPQRTSSPAWHMGFRTTTMKATACLGQKWWYWNLWEIVGKQPKNERIIQNNTLKIWGFCNCYRCYGLHIQNNRCQKKWTYSHKASSCFICKVGLDQNILNYAKKSLTRLPLLNVTTFKLQS